MEEPVRRRGGLARRYHPLQQARRQRSGALEDGRHHIRERGPALRASGSLLKPDRAPGVGDPPPSREPGLVLLQAAPAPALSLAPVRAYRRGRARALPAPRLPAPSARSRPSSSNSGRGLARARLRLPGACCLQDVPRRRADQAVAGPKAVIEEGQRPIGRQRRQPQRQPAQLHGHRIAIHAVQASLRDGPPEPGPVRVREIAGRRPSPRESTPARRRSRDIGTPPRGTRRCPSPGRRPAAQESRQARRRAPAARASGERAIPSAIAACRRSPVAFRRSDGTRRAGKVLGQREIEEPFVDPAELLDSRGRRRRSARAHAPRAHAPRAWPAGSSAPATPPAPRHRPAPGRPRAGRAPARTAGR